MNKKQLKYYRMFIAVQNTLDKNNAIWSSHSKFSEAKEDFDLSLGNIQNLSDDVLDNTKAETSEKNQIRKDLESKLLPLSGVLNAYAALSKDEGLKTLFVSNISGIESMKETNLVTYSNNLVAKVNELRDVLIKEYDVSAEEIDAVSTQTTIFKNLIGTAKPKRAAINAAKQTLNDHIDQANTLLKEVIDNFMLRYQTTEPQFFNEYQQSRTIVD